MTAWWRIGHSNTSCQPLTTTGVMWLFSSVVVFGKRFNGHSEEIFNQNSPCEFESLCSCKKKKRSMNYYPQEKTNSEVSDVMLLSEGNGQVPWIMNGFSVPGCDKNLFEEAPNITDNALQPQATPLVRTQSRPPPHSIMSPRYGWQSYIDSYQDSICCCCWSMLVCSSDTLYRQSTWLCG